MHIEPDAIRDVIRRFPAVIESSAYTASEPVVGVKRVRELIRDLIRRQGQEKFGPLTPAQTQKFNSIEDFDRLERLGVRLIKAKSWEELLKGKPNFEEPGAAQLLREAILQVGQQKFGPPTPDQIKKLEAIKVTKRLARLGVRLHQVDTWNELLKVK